MVPRRWVAERWEVSDDQLTYTFHLRPGVKFHDGSEVTAMDVAWSIDKAMQSGSWEALDNIDAIDIGSDYVSVVLKAADSDFLSYMTLAITPENHADGADPVGNGPFKFISRAAQQNLVLERFADYWGGRRYQQHSTEGRIHAGAGRMHRNFHHF